MRTLAIALLVAGCSSAREPAPARDPAPAREPPPVHGDYCRGRGTFTPTEIPLGTPSTAPSIPAHTFSIVARDPITGDLGVAVQSHFFSVGSAVTWAEPGVGAVATQAFVERGYGPKGLALMRDGLAPADAMATLVAADKQQDVRQLGFVDNEGRVASHTGAKCIVFAGSHTGAGYAVQANMMGNDKVVPAMSTAFEAAKGDLADRMLAALDAGQAAGGDVRGCQSAAIVVVSGKRTDTPWNERKLDLRVEDSADPLLELRRLVVLARAYNRTNKGDTALEKNDVAGGLEHYRAAMNLAPDNVELKYWTAVTMTSLGKVDDAIPLFKIAFADNPAWIELTRRLVKPGILPDTPAGRAAVERVLREAR